LPVSITSVSPSQRPIEWPSELRGPLFGCAFMFMWMTRFTSIHSWRSTTLLPSRTISRGVPGAPHTRRMATGSQRNVGSSLNGS
jgi:hypothetical protein